MSYEIDYFEKQLREDLNASRIKGSDVRMENNRRPSVNFGWNSKARFGVSEYSNADRKTKNALITKFGKKRIFTPSGRIQRNYSG